MRRKKEEQYLDRVVKRNGPAGKEGTILEKGGGARTLRQDRSIGAVVLYYPVQLAGFGNTRRFFSSPHIEQLCLFVSFGCWGRSAADSTKKFRGAPHREGSVFGSLDGTFFCSSLQNFIS